MASPLSQLITNATTGYGGGYTPFAQVGQGSPSYTAQSSYNGPSGSVQEQANNWNPYAQSVNNQINMWQQRKAQEAANEAQSPLTNTGGSSSLGTLGGDWAGVDQWNAQIQASSAKYGVDPNVIKALMKLESGGDPGATGSSGVGGLMQINSNVWGNGPWMTDNNANIDKGVEIFKTYLDAAGGDMYEALRGYHGYGSDGYTTDTQYADIVMGNYNQLRNNSSTLGNGTTPATGLASNAWTAITGGQSYPISQEMGLNDFSAQHLGDMYAYGSAYGVTGHAGIDVATPGGTPLYSPVGGTVTIAGGSGYYCWYDSCGPGVGELMVQLDNGDQLILGHMSSIGVQVGQRVNAGAYVGVSGGAGTGDHVHVEYRTPNNSTSSGYLAVDPRTVLGGGAVNLTGSSGGGTTTPQTQPKQDYWSTFMSYFR